MEETRGAGRGKENQAGPTGQDDRVLITGGTGFFGCNLLERIPDGLDVTVLTRDAEAFRSKAPGLAAKVTLWEGSVESKCWPGGGFDCLLHMAPILGRVLEYALDVDRFVLVSSGAACDERHGYGQFKREQEDECLRWIPDALIARCYSFVGPYLEFDHRSAIGDFIRDGLNGKPIRVLGDGKSVRSWMYSGDLADVLWSLVKSRDPGGIRHIGSREAVTIRDTASLVAQAFSPPLSVTIDDGPDTGFGQRVYLPPDDCLSGDTSLSDAIRCTIDWNLDK